MSTSALASEPGPLPGVLSAAPGRSALACLAALATGAAALLQPALIGRVVDAISRGQSASRPLIWLALIMAVAALAGATGSFAAGTYVAKSVLFLRERLITHVVRLGPSAQSSFSGGDLTSRLTLDTTTPATILPTAVTVAVSLATSIGALVALSIIDWRLTVTFVAAVPIVMVVVRRFVVDAGSLTGRYRKLQSEIATRLMDAHVGIRTILVSGTQSREVARVTAPLSDVTLTGRRLWSSQRRVSWQTALLLSLVEVLVLAVAGLGVSAGRLEPGQLLAAAGYVALAMAGFDSLDTATQLVQARVGVARVSEVLAVPGHRTKGPAPTTLPVDGNGELLFDHVTVRREGHTVLDGVTLTVAAGASVAVVGRSGSGKSTLAALLGRLVEPDEGQVFIDGTDVRSVSASELHGAVAYAFDRPARLGATVAELIALRAATPGTTEGAVAAGLKSSTTEAAKAAHADEFIRRLPDGYDTPLERAPFSGGELQRLGIAQALVRPARVLVFDDATSSLDMATELEVTNAVAGASVGRTKLTVTQRVTTAARADLVVWLEEGRVRGYAPHHDLCRDPDYLATIAPGVAEEVNHA
jgi:ATP-binding cassette, subfamily B, bacterial